MKKGQIEKVNEKTSDCFISPIAVTGEKYGTSKLAMDSTAIN